MRHDDFLFPLIALYVALGIVISQYVVVSYGMTICITIVTGITLLILSAKASNVKAHALLIFFFILIGFHRAQYGALPFVPHSLLDSVAQIPVALSDALNHTSLSERTKGLLQAMLLGMRGNLDTTVRDLFRQAGASHVLALSGLHLGILFGVLSFWLQRVLVSRWRYVVGFLSLAMMWCYVMITGFPVSLCRASLMMTLLVVAQMRLEGSNGWHMLGFSAFLLLLVNPMTLFDIGFQLSFAAVAGILLFYEPMTQIWLPQQKAMRWFVRAVMVSIAAQMGVLPLLIYWFHQFTIVAIITSPFIIIFTSIILYLAILLLPLSVFGLGSIVAYCIELLVDAEIGLMKLSLWVPMSRVEGIYLTEGQVFLLYCALLCMLPPLRALSRSEIELPYRRLAMFFRTWPYIAGVMIVLFSLYMMQKAR